MKKLIFILVLIAAFATQSFAHCPIPQWCPSAPLHQTLCPSESIEDIEFPSVIAKVLIVTWWTDGTRIHSFEDPPPGITVSGAASTPLGDREYAWPVSIKGTPTTPGTHHYTVSNTCGVELLHGSITINTTPPTIGMVTPTTDQTTWQNIAFDSTLTLTADPIGSMLPITIQWYSSTTASTTGGTNLGAANGAQTNTFTPPIAIPTAPGIYYYAVATDRCGRTVTTTNTSGKHIVVPVCNPPSPINCHMTQTPVFAGGSLGTPYFRTSQVWEISGNGIKQEWSDVVLAPGCNHATYSSTGSSTTPFTSACRWSLNNSGVNVDGNGTRPASTQTPGGSTYYGDYFSWCMVHRYAAQFCWGTWRVPTCQDFVNLDVALGSSGYNISGYTNTDIVAKYVGTSASGDAGQFWGSAYGGTCNSTGVLNGQGLAALYWGATSTNLMTGFRLFFVWDGTISQYTSAKTSGLVLRCVRNVP